MLHTRFMVECPLFIGIVSSRKPPQRSRHSTSRPPAGQPRTTSWCMENEVGQVWLMSLIELLVFQRVTECRTIDYQNSSLGHGKSSYLNTRRRRQTPIP